MIRLESFGRVELTSPDGDLVVLDGRGRSMRASFASWRSLRRIKAHVDRARPFVPAGIERLGRGSLDLEVAVGERVVARGTSGSEGVSWRPRWRGIVAAALRRR